jgi:murein DD-endopeptidase MepM/ murein hydrolase activator NlpD
MRHWRKIFFIAMVGVLVASQNAPLVLAEDVGDEIQAINDEISTRRLKIDQITSQIGAYQAKIKQAESTQASLNNEVELLENRAAQTLLEVEVTNEEIDNLDAEMRLTDKDIAVAENSLSRERELLAAVLREIHSTDNTSVVEWLLGSESFSDLSNYVEDLETVHDNLNQGLKKILTTKDSLENLKSEQETRMLSLEKLQNDLEEKLSLFEDQKNAKTSLLAETAASEAEFQALLSELYAEEQAVSRQITALQYDIELKLKQSDSAGDSSALSWPVYPEKGLSATFHDPTYPFRHLFEHPGIDIPIPVGTPIKSVAPGYVAWVREGRMYGYYVLVIHAGGVSSLYAHLSKITVETDRYVARGETIGLSGGRPGMPGAGLSTGPHLHFEIRKEGIPIDPLNYLVSY